MNEWHRQGTVTIRKQVNCKRCPEIHGALCLYWILSFCGSVSWIRCLFFHSLKVKLVCREKVPCVTENIKVSFSNFLSSVKSNCPFLLQWFLICLKKAEKILVGTEGTCSSLTLFAKLSDELQLISFPIVAVTVWQDRFLAKTTVAYLLAELDFSKCQFSSLV